MRMIFNRLKIERESYGEKKGQLIGSISYKGEQANIELKLNNEQIDKIFHIVADRLVEVSKEAAHELTVDIIEHQKQLPANE